MDLSTLRDGHGDRRGRAGLPALHLPRRELTLPLYDVTIAKLTTFRLAAASAAEAREIGECLSVGRAPRRLPPVEVVSRTTASSRSGRRG